MMQLTTLANGLRVASRPMPSVETVAVGLYADDRLAPRAGAAQRHRPSVRAYGVQGRRRPLGARDQRGDRGCRRRPQRLRPTARRPASTASLLRRASAARRRADRRPGPPPAFRGRAISSARRRSCSRSWARRATRRRDIIFDDLQEAAFPGPAARPLGARRRGRASPRSRVDDLHDWRDRPLSRRQPDPGRGRQGRARRSWSSSPRQRFGDLRRGRDRRRRAGALHRRRPLRAARRRPGASRLGYAGAGAGATPDSYAAQLFADVVGGGASSRLFQAAARGAGPGLFGLGAGSQPYRRLRPVLGLCRDRPRRRGSWPHGEIERVLAEAAATLDAARARPRAERRPRRAC